jgi:hypothetical protein
MLKQHVLKLVLGLAIMASLLGGGALVRGTATARVAPAHSLACAQIWLPPC